MNIPQSFLNALGFLTILPARSKNTLEEDDFGRFPGVFPLVGLVLGMLLTLFWLLAGQVLPPALSAVFTVAILTALTRGFHLDGLADAADALFSHKSLDDKLRIMKDSRQGTFGVLAIVLDILLKVQLLSHLALEGEAFKNFWPALLLMPLWGRLAASVTAVRSGYVRPEGGLGCHIVQNSRPRDLGLALATALAISLPFGWKAFLTTAAVAVFGLFLTWVWKKALGGLTGDLLGATVELGELAALLIWLVI